MTQQNPYREPAAIQNLQEAGHMVAAAAKKTRLVNWFDVPQALANQVGVEKVGMVELTTGEELMATKRAQNDVVRLAYELAKESLRFVNDSPLSSGDLSADEFWARSSPGFAKLRQLVLAAYGVIHNPSSEISAAFLLSRRQSVAS